MSRSLLRVVGLLLHHAHRPVDICARVLREAATMRLSIADLRQMIERRWSAYEPHADDWFEWERQIADRLIAGGSRILLVGCGSGRDLVPLLRAGCDVTGIDPARSAIDRARARVMALGLTATLRCEYFEDATLEGPYDVIWMSWGAYSYVPGSDRRIDAMHRAVRHLAAGGCVVVSGWTNPPASRVSTTVSAVLQRLPLEWHLEPGDVLRDHEADLTIEHQFAPGELEDELRRAGMTAAWRHSHEDALEVLVATPTT